MYIITYKVVKNKGVEGTYNTLEEAKEKLKKLQNRYTETKFMIRNGKSNSLYKYTGLEDIFKWGDRDE